MTTVPLYSHDWIDENLLLVGGGAGMLGLWDTRMLDQPANSWQLAGHRVLGDVNLHGSTTSGCVFSTGGYGAGLFHVAAGECGC